MRILIIIVTGGDTVNYIQNIIDINKFMLDNYTDDIIEYACISSSDNFHHYSDIINIKYKMVNEKKQLSKVCDFITKYQDNLNYDWFIKIRPELELRSKINLDKLCKLSIHARAREYKGPKKILFGNSVSGIGEYKQYNDSSYSNTEDIVVLDDMMYIFHRNVIDMGAFKPIEYNIEWYKRDTNVYEWEHEWFHSKCFKARNINLIPISINLVLKRSKYVFMESGHINI